MADGEHTQETLKQNLRQAIDRLHQDIEAVEFWTEALRSFSQPIPDYEPGNMKFPVPSKGDGESRFDYTRIGMRT